ncbi:ZPR1 zinc finger domain-containing protein [Candidatus Woesearchaeota archaeon]|nr:ZPR1 zinc finger domain-containing protein [Candidatus Woesearchaeota archaeon]
MSKLENQPCPICREKKLTLVEEEIEIPFFGKTFVFSMECSACGFRKADVEAAEAKEPAKYTFEISSAKDMNVRIVKSSNAIVKFPQLKITIEPGADAEGYVANVEKILNDIYERTKDIKENEEDSKKRKKAWKLMDKILDIKEGKEKTTLVIEDHTGNSAIISQKAQKTALKGKKKK